MVFCLPRPRRSVQPHSRSVHFQTSGSHHLHVCQGCRLLGGPHQGPLGGFKKHGGTR